MVMMLECVEVSELDDDDVKVVDGDVVEEVM